MPHRLRQLVELTRSLGDPAREYVVVGEGNTSWRIDDHAFWIKASGQGMQDITADGFVAIQFAPILETLSRPDLPLDDQKAIAQSARVNPDAPTRPSVEVSFHAMLLFDCEAQIIAHTHPIAINRILCSNRAGEFARNRMFPDEVVLCGPESVFVPYADPGLPLALAIREKTRAYMSEYQEAPRVILLASHGLIVLAQTPAEALNITTMCVKAASIFAGACAIGKPVFMSKEDIAHIYRRPDEIYRRRVFVEK